MLTYSELIRIPTFEERLEYLRLRGEVGYDTFGFDRFMNQQFYRSSEWKRLRQSIILRDGACDLGCEGYDIPQRIIIHHMNPIRQDDIVNSTEFLLNPEFLICCSHATHNAIHYGIDHNDIPKVSFERKPGDTKLW